MTKIFFCLTNNVNIGISGEKIAIGYLKNIGFQIIETNWRWKHKEIDIIAIDNDTLVIVEVKTRKNNIIANAESFVDKKKQKNLLIAAENYLIEKNIDYDVRFDVISVYFEKGIFKDMAHIKNAFNPEF